MQRDASTDAAPWQADAVAGAGGHPASVNELCSP